jgi:hypothetical protein
MRDLLRITFFMERGRRKVDFIIFLANIMKVLNHKVPINGGTRAIMNTYIEVNSILQINSMVMVTFVYKLGVLEEPTGIYEGNFVDGLKNGKGLYRYKNGLRYEGHYKQG